MQQQDQEPVVTLQLAREHGLTQEEYDQILKLLGRIPTYTELGIYSVMWSEHCSYKNSIALIKTLPRTGKNLLVSAGEENAGLVDIGDGLAVAFKIESHNHPSAVEPYQGAATGVGGILRDIFTMGARPVAALNSLRFGELKEQRARYLFKNVVKGIGDYGNSFGVPTVGGEVYFQACYRDNPLVNAMAVGVVRHDGIARATARGVGNSVLIVGSATGRDGIHGATFASEEISDASESKRPSVQVGDPFTEKLLLEATLEAIQTGFIVGIQDMGAAGLTCSSTEMSAKGDVGMDIRLDRVPIREEGMTSYEIMLSESQERMLLVVKKGHEGDVQNVFNKWDLPAIVIGEITSGNSVRVFHHGQLKAEVDARSLVLGGGAPVYHRESKRPGYLDEVRSFEFESVPAPRDLNKVLVELLGSTTISSKRWVYDQYDSMVRTNSVLVPGGGDAAVVRLKETRKGLSICTDCNSRYVYLNPRRGGEIAVAEAARNVVCTGAKPIAITNCLNFGNPYDPEVYWQFKEAIGGIGDACRVLGTPVTGGNVSFYNESPDVAVYPTPVIGMLGVLQDVERAISHGVSKAGLAVILLGKNSSRIDGSEYLFQCTGKVAGDAPAIDLMYEKRLQDLCLLLIDRGLVLNAHDVSEGGVGVALAEMCMEQGMGMMIDPKLASGTRADFWLFAESQSLILIAVEQRSVGDVRSTAHETEIDSMVLGFTADSGALRIGEWINVEIEVLRRSYERGIPEVMGDGV